jgi:hypothetical protein
VESGCLGIFGVWVGDSGVRGNGIGLVLLVSMGKMMGKREKNCMIMSVMRWKGRG